LTDYQSNSRKDREKKQAQEEKKIDKVVIGEVVLKPKSPGRKFKEVFFGGDAKQALRFVSADVLLPALRSMLVEASSNAWRGFVEKLTYGESAYRRPRPTDYSSRTIYTNPTPLATRMLSDPRTSVGRLPDQRPVHRARRSVNDVIVATREDADSVVERLIDILNQYDVASIADLYYLLGLESEPIDNKWGWSYLNNIEVRQIREGFLIELPPLEEI
jgi:hypothetical protein